MQRTIEETGRRRRLQHAFNEEHGITPQTIRRTRADILQTTSVLERVKQAEAAAERPRRDYSAGAAEDAVEDMVAELERQMNEAAAALEFEKAAGLRDEIARLKEQDSDRRAG
jgi:excinuclease ABC subunit B